MELGLIRKIDIDSEMQQSYLDYAMSVIVQRALPDARDGLKPVQRRVLYAMYDMGIRPDSSYKKSARIVGEVLGKYHPHGDVAVYESMARLAQDFTMRYALVDGQGNFGSVDGDPPAAMRYTEARLSRFAMEMLGQIDRDTVNFGPNFDGTLSEPEVLPAAAPNLLVNGASGIAVGMATNIPPHNLGEIVDALVLLLHEWERMDDLSVSDLMRFVQGPDFPTGGIIIEEHGQNELLQAYASGRGRVIVRGRVQKEDMERGKSRLIISELPYQVNKSALIERIADLVREGNLEGIADLRDESDRQGMRIVIELKAGVESEGVLRQLYQRTPMETTFSIMLLALVNGEPRLLSLKQALRVYLEHRLVVVKRRSEYDLARAKARAHILEGLRIALANLDEIIALIKAAPDADQARERLIKRFKLTEIQAQAILDMQLRRLAALERKKIEQEYKELQALIHDLEGLLKSPKKMRQVVEEELLALKVQYNDKRRTRIVSLKAGESADERLTTNEITPAQAVWIGIMEDGLIGRAHEDALPRLSGRAAPRWLMRADTHHTLYLALADGRAAAVAVESIPEVEKFTDGVPLNKVSPLEPDEPLAAAVTLPPRSAIQGDVFVMTVSRQGMVKKTGFDELPGPSTQRFVMAKVNSGDSIGWTFVTDGNAEIFMATAGGMAIRFSEKDVRPMGLVAAGVNGVKLAGADQVIGAARLAGDQEILALATNGKGWRLPASEFPVQGRYGQGVQVCKLETGNRLAGILVGAKDQGGLIHFRQAAARSLRVDEILAGKRMRAGQEVAPVKPGDGVVDITPVRDGLSPWIPPEAGEKKRGQKREAPARRVPPPEIFEEQQIQAALPGLDGLAAPVQSEAQAKNPPAKKEESTRSPENTKPESPKKKETGARTMAAAEPLPLPQTEASAPKSKPRGKAQPKSDKQAAVARQKLPTVKKAAPPQGKSQAPTAAAPVSKPAPPKAAAAAKVKPTGKPAASLPVETTKTSEGKKPRVKQPSGQAKAAVSAPLTAQAIPAPAGTKSRAKSSAKTPADPEKTASRTKTSTNTKKDEKGKTTVATTPQPVSKPASRGKKPSLTVLNEARTSRGVGKAAPVKKTGPEPAELHGWEQIDLPQSTHPAGKKPRKNSAK